MSCLYHCVAVLPLLIGASPDQSQFVVRSEEPRRYVVVERQGKPPVVVLGSSKILARDDLVGTWQVAYFEREGKSRPDLVSGLQMKFSRGRLELMQQGCQTIVVAYDMTVTDYPRHFNWFHRPGGRISMQKGVLWLEGDTLMLCLGAISRPPATEFLTEPGDGRTLFVLERTGPQD
jgi:uncharacterized protein (TIGR03067 family)